MFLSDELIDKLKNQIVSEKHNSNIYLCFYQHLDVMGLSNLAKFFYEQAKEENEHANMILQFLSDMDIHISIPLIPGVDETIADYKYIGDRFLELEIETTKSIQNCLDQAYEDGDGISQKFLLDFIYEQREEIANASKIKNQLNNVSDIYLFDNTFKA